MTRLLVLAGLLLSLIVPGGGAALIIAQETDSAPSGYDHDEMVDIHNRLVSLGKRAEPGSAKDAAEARQIGAEAAAWQEKWDAAPEWEELAAATVLMADVMARAIEDPSSVTEQEIDQAEARISTAEANLPTDRQPLE